MKKRLLLLSFSLLLSCLPVTAENWKELYDNAAHALEVEEYDTAERLFQRIVNTGDKDAANNALARAGLAETLLWQGKFKDATKQFKVVWKNIKALEERPELANIYDAYSWLLQAQGKAGDAYSYAKQGLAMREKLAPNSDDLAESYEHVGELSEAQGLYKEASELYSKALAIRSQGGEKQVASHANLLERLGLVEAKLGHDQKASQLLTDSLNEKAQLSPSFQKYTAHEPWQTVMYRYSRTAPNCSRVAVEGESLATITSPDGVTVQAIALPATDFKGTTAFVRVINNGHAPIEFLPKPPILVVLSPQVKIANVIDSDKLATDIEKKGSKKASMIRFFEGGATTPVTSTIQTGGQVVRPGWGWAPYRVPRQMTTVTTMVPDYEARARAEAKAQAAVEKASSAAALIRNQKLLATTLQPGEMIQGSAQFDVTNIRDGLLRVPIGNAMFEFPLSQP